MCVVHVTLVVRKKKNAQQETFGWNTNSLCMPAQASNQKASQAEKVEGDRWSSLSA